MCIRDRYRPGGILLYAKTKQRNDDTSIITSPICPTERNETSFFDVYASIVFTNILAINKLSPSKNNLFCNTGI